MSEQRLENGRYKQENGIEVSIPGWLISVCEVDKKSGGEEHWPWVPLTNVNLT